MLVVGVQVQPIISILGFVIMLAGAIVGVNSWRRVAGDDNRDGGEDPARPQKPAGPSPAAQDFMAKLEERWRRSQGNDDL